MNLPVRSPRFVIGLTGPVGSGTTTVADALKQNGFKSVSLSSPIKAELFSRERIPPGTPLIESAVPGFRRKLQAIGDEGRCDDPAYWLKAAIETVADEHDGLVIDSVRNLGEVAALRQAFSMFFLIAVCASPEVRWNRVKNDYDNNQRLFKEDDKRDSGEGTPYGQQVEKCVLDADYVLINDQNAGSSERRPTILYEKLKPDIELMQAIGQPPTGYRRPPTKMEIHMATAYAQSHASECLKRHVGAVIVDENEFALSVGFNENPLGMQPCRTKYRFCFKDSNMETKLEQINRINCPKCGTDTALSKPWKCENVDCESDLKSLFFPSRNMELCTAIHAEERAIRSLAGRSAKGGTIYTTTFPCFQCARYIVDAELKRVVFVEAYPIEESLEFLKQQDVLVEPFSGFKARAFNLVFKQVE